MEVILLERVAKLGQMGEVVRVKDGFARNFLLKRGKALRATADNRAKFDGVKAARSADEAERINRGEDISTRQEDQDAAAEAIAAAGEFFDPEAHHDEVEPQQQATPEK